MPSPFGSAKNSNPHKKGSLNHDLWETERDIQRAEKGIPGEASLDEMKQARKRIKDEINANDIEEGKAQVEEMMGESKFMHKRSKMRKYAPVKKTVPIQA
ncbi:hypothetical protein UFOVP861_11 [uncultured Caudovirales phage]|uniref:Uncharacterized protein n=1 Tax=uncultured Caudovirales phage TaxID=2100421 RepID=A0A6J5PBJ1_9CAUD|nr:hypothetical protein UFOVP861_11 [uncultured Caudovirales phage]